MRRTALALLVIIPLVLVAMAAANTGTVHLTSAYKYESTTYSTYVGWNSDLYMDSLNYGLGADSHINFTDASMGSSSNPSWTFGLVAQNGNVNVSTIATNYVRVVGATQATKTLNVTFYYIALPAEVQVAAPANTSILASSYYTVYATWVAAAQPAVYENSTGGFLMVKSVATTPTIQFDANAATVIQPVKITLGDAGVAGTFALTTCAPSPSSVSSDGSVHDVTMSPLCATTVTGPSSPGVRYVFSNGLATETVTSCASGTCAGADLTAYLQYQVSFHASPLGASTPSPSGVVWVNTTAFAISTTGNAGFTFERWSASAAGITFASAVTASTTVTVTAAGNITAVYNPPGGVVFVQSAVNTCYSVNSCKLTFAKPLTVGNVVVLEWSGIWVQCMGTSCEDATPSATTTSAGSYTSLYVQEGEGIPWLAGSSFVHLANGSAVQSLEAGDAGYFDVTNAAISNAILANGLTVGVTSGETMNSSTFIAYEVHVPFSFATADTVLSAWWQGGGPTVAGSVNPLTTGEDTSCSYVTCDYPTPMILPPASDFAGASNYTAWVGLSRWTGPGVLGGNESYFQQTDGANYIAQNATFIIPSSTNNPPTQPANSFVGDITEEQSDVSFYGFGVGVGFFVNPDVIPPTPGGGGCTGVCTTTTSTTTTSVTNSTQTSPSPRAPTTCPSSNPTICAIFYAPTPFINPFTGQPIPAGELFIVLLSTLILFLLVVVATKKKKKKPGQMQTINFG